MIQRVGLRQAKNKEESNLLLELTRTSAVSFSKKTVMPHLQIDLVILPRTVYFAVIPVPTSLFVYLCV